MSHQPYGRWCILCERSTPLQPPLAVTPIVIEPVTHKVKTVRDPRDSRMSIGKRPQNARPNHTN